VLFGRYKMVSGQLKDYAYGLYGQPPAAMDAEVVAIVLKDYEHGQEPVSARPADFVEPEMEKSREAIKEISTKVEDVLTYALYPTTGLKFLRMKYGLDPVPDEMKPKTLEQVEQERAAKAGAARPARRKATDVPPKSGRARLFNVYVGDEYYRVEVDPVTPSEGGASITAVAADAQAPESGDAGADQTVVVAPMPGIVLRYPVEIGQDVEEGQPVVVLEAMKMENTLPSPVSGKVSSLPVQVGSTVAKGDVLVTIVR
jgi:biotin carboxyl carrier protein